MVGLVVGVGASTCALVGGVAIHALAVVASPLVVILGSGVACGLVGLGAAWVFLRWAPDFVAIDVQASAVEEIEPADEVPSVAAPSAHEDEIGAQVIATTAAVSRGLDATVERVQEAATSVFGMMLSVEEVERCCSELETELGAGRGALLAVVATRTALEQATDKVAKSLQDAATVLDAVGRAAGLTEAEAHSLRAEMAATEKTLSDTAEAMRAVRQTAEETEQSSTAVIADCERALAVGEQTRGGIGRIETAFLDASANLDRILEGMGQIQRLAAFIREFAEDSGLLALNLAVIAAKAREVPGLDVIAAEMRNLAARTRQVVSDVEIVARDLATGSVESAAVMNTVQGEIEASVFLAQSSEAALVEIRRSASRAADALGGVAATAMAAVEAQGVVGRTFTRAERLAESMGQRTADEVVQLGRLRQRMGDALAVTDELTATHAMHGERWRAVEHTLGRVAGFGEQVAAAQVSQREAADKVVVAVEAIAATAGEQGTAVQELESVVEAWSAGPEQVVDAPRSLRRFDPNADGLGPAGVLGAARDDGALAMTVMKGGRAVRSA